MIERLFRPAYYRWLAWRERYRPPLALSAVLKHCEETLANPPAAKGGDEAAQSEALARAFRNRPNAHQPFMPVRRLGELAGQMLQHRPEWVKRTLERVALLTEREMTNYCRRLPPLNGDFPWGGIEPGMGGDRTYAFQPQRFFFAPQLSLALHYDPGLADRWLEILDSWLTFAIKDKAEIAYATKLVVTQRFLALSWSWGWLAARPAEQLKPRDWQLEAKVLRILYSDARFLLQSVGNEFPNNHLLADWFTTWYVEFLFPEFLLPAERQRGHEQGWLSELERQTYRDGTSFEHSVHYHEAVVEMATAYLLLMRSNGQKVPDWVDERVHRMLRFQADVHGNQGEALAMGNTMEDPMFSLDAGGGWSIGGNRELLRALYEPQLVPAVSDDPSVERAFWLLAGKLAPAPEDPEDGPALRQYPEGGFHVLRDQGEELVFRTGPAPELPLCGGHMHADLLSIYLRLQDQPLLVEAGTGTYLISTPDSLPPWRRYFMEPAAHNGLTIDGKDPVEPVTGSYRSRNLATRVSLLRSNDQGGLCWLEGRIDSENEYDGQRRGVIRVMGNYWLIYDRHCGGLDGQRAWSGFQLERDAQVEQNAPGLVRIKRGDAHLWISNTGGAAQVLAGSHEPLAGWVSRAYGVVEPAPQLRYPVAGGHAAWLLTPGPEECAPFRIEALASSDQGVTLRIGSADATDYLFIATAPEGAAMEIAAWNIQFTGGLLWLRESAAGPSHLRMIGGNRLAHERHGIALQAEAGAANLSLRDEGGQVRIEAGCIDDWQQRQWRGADLVAPIPANDA